MGVILLWFAQGWIEGYLRRRVSTEIAKMADVKLSISKVTLNFNGIELREGALYPVGQQGASNPLLRFKRARVFMPLWPAFRGNVDLRRVDVTNPELTLHLSKSGELIRPFTFQTSQANAPNEINVVNASVRILQAGHDPLVARQINGDLVNTDGTLILSGSIGEALNTSWTFDGKLSPESGNLNVNVSTEHLEVSSQLLLRVPQLSLPSALPPARVEMGLACSLSINDATVAYRAEITPRRFEIDMHDKRIATRLSDGTIRVTPTKIEANDVRVAANGAEAVTRFSYDMKNRRGNVVLTFDQLAIHKLIQDATEMWPVDSIATVGGQAELQFVADQDGWNISGTSAAVSHETMLFGVRAESASASFEFEPFHLRPNASMSEMLQRPVGNASVKFAVADITKPKVDHAVSELQSWLSTHKIALNLEMNTIAERLPRNLNCDLKGEFKFPLRQSLNANEIDGQVTIGLAPLEVRGVTFELRDHLELSLARGRLETQPFRVTATESPDEPPAQLLAKASMSVRLDDDLSIAARVRGLPSELPMRLANFYQAESALQRNGESEPEIQPLGDASGPPRDLDQSSEQRLPVATIDFTLAGRVPLRRITEADAWTARGDFRAAEVSLPQIPAAAITDVSGNYSLRDGLFAFNDVSAFVQQQPIAGQGKIQLQSPFQFRVHGKTKTIAIADVTQTVVGTETRIGGTAQVQGRLTGTISPFSFAAKGRSELRQIRWNELELGSSLANWSADPENVRLETIDAELFNGQLAVEATYPFKTGENSVLRGDLKGADLALLRQAAPQMFSGLSEAIVLGRENVLTFSLTNWHQLDKSTGQATFAAKSVRVEALELENLEGRVDVEDNTFQFETAADLLTGRVEAQATGKLRELLDSSSRRWDAVQASAQLQRIAVGPAMQRLGIAAFASTSGTLNANLELVANTTGQPQLGGAIELNDLQWSRRRLSRRATLDLLATRNGATISNLLADFAGGQVRGSTELRPDGTGRFRLQANDIDASMVLDHLEQDRRIMSGKIDGSLQGTVGERWVGQGQFRVNQAKLYNLSVAQLRVPVEASFTPARSELRLITQKLTARVARGRVAAQGDLQLGQRTDLRTSVNAQNLELKSLLSELAGVRRSGAGTVSGRLQLSGRDVRTLNDLVGNFEADLSQVQPFQFPVLRQVGRFLGPVQPTSTFEHGAASGRIAGGAILLEPTTIEGGLARILLEGRATFRGELDLDVTAQTGDLNAAASGVSGLVRAPLAVAAPLPIAAVAELNDFLANRLIFLHIDGTVRRPAIRVQPARQLQREAIQFFLRRALGNSLD